MSDSSLITPVDRALSQRRRRNWIIAIVVIGVIFMYLYSRYAPDRPVTYRSAEDHFKYGSIGSDIENGIPVRILQVLPRMFPEYLPEGAPQDYTAFGFTQEAGHDLPIGFSTRRRVIDLAGVNCSACHVGQVRASPEEAPMIIPGMPANTVDLQAFFEFLFAAANDPRFTADNLIAEVKKDGRLNFVDSLIYGSAVPRLQAGLLLRENQLEAFMLPDHPRFGAGRVDTFNPYKTNQFAEHYPPGSLSEEERVGTADYPSVWNQDVRDGLHLHWDGNNSSVRERNFSAAFGAGATRENVDSDSFDRVTVYLSHLNEPAYPFGISDDADILARGEEIYAQYCYECHDFEGSEVGQVVPLAEVGTDPNRLDSYTEKLAAIQLDYGNGYDWDWQHFKKTDGYANHPMDGIWARAPYLHNGSVPSLWDLLTPAEERNNGEPSFYRGHGVYDPVNVGFRTDVAEVDGRPSFEFVLSERGNSNAGHSGEAYGTELSDDDKWALIEYLKTQ